MPGPNLRTDIVDVYVFRVVEGHRAVGPRLAPAPGQDQPLGQDRKPLPVHGAAEFLQLRRVKGALAGTWHPVMGHIENTESAVEAAKRELAEETGYRPGRGLIGLWQLETVNPYYMASQDAIMLSPCFAAQVDTSAESWVDPAHDAARWVRRDQTDRAFLWPGQRAAIDQIVRDILPAALGYDCPVASLLRVELESISSA